MSAERHTDPKSITVDHAKAVQRAADYFAQLARGGELPFTPAGLERRAKEFFNRMDEKLGASNALALAALHDLPCPQSLFAPWASPSVIWQWRRAKVDPLPVEILNGKVMLKPSAFFAALRQHGIRQQGGDESTEGEHLAS